ncbi:MAG: ferritin family protein [Myxococcota bacterium]|jgi:rubrerythrin|nr:ferritin family protein [Myxococcota bacterium]
MAKLNLSTISLMDALDLALLIEREARERYELFAAQLGYGGGYDAGAFFASMAESEAKHGHDLEARRKALFGDTPAKMKSEDVDEIEAPEMGAPRRGMSVVQAFEVGLAAEKRAHDFYESALPHITDPEVRALFIALRDEETEHLEMLQAAMAKLPASASEMIEFDLDESPFL